MDVPFAERALQVRRSASLLCRRLGWAPLHEVPLPNGRRADILALRPDGGFACIEVKSGVRDFLLDSKWPAYRDYSDELYFAVAPDFPVSLLSDDVGIIVAEPTEAVLLRGAQGHPMPPGRRRAMTHRFALLAAERLETLLDPVGTTWLRSALKVE